MTNAKDVEDQIQSLVGAGVAFLFAWLPDITGRMKGKAISIGAAADAVRNGVAFQLDAIPGLGQMGPAEDDLVGSIDLARVTMLPWQPGFAAAPVRLSRRGAVHAYDMRAVLQRQIDRAEALGFSPMLGIEPEFYGLRATARKSMFDDDRTAQHGVNHDLDAILRAAPMLRAMADQMDSLGWGVTVLDHEFGRGQYEITFDYCEMMEMIDRMTLFRHLADAVARDHGSRATFMPKPFADDAGSGAHMNISLFDRDRRTNVFSADGVARTGGVSGFSDIAHQFTAGVLAHADAITALACPGVNSYKRLAPRRAAAPGQVTSWAPVYTAYGRNARTLICRFPSARCCLEVRHPDPSCNFFLAGALLLAAGLEGVETKRDPGPPFDVDTRYLSDADVAEHNIARVPDNLGAALDALARDPLAREVLGSALLGEYIQIKRAEMARFSEYVTDWELVQYL